MHIMSTPMECFSAEAPDSQRVEHGKGSWWNALLVHNMDPAQKDKKPFSCALRCGHTWGAKTANAFKVAGHIAGDINDVKFCKKATPADIALAKSKRLKQPAKAQAEAPPDAKRAKVEAMAGTAVPGSPPGTGPRQSATAEVEHAAAEEVREAGLTGMFRHMNDKAACGRLDQVWARAIAHAGLPPKVIENEYLRDAILQTSLANAAYTVPHVDVFTRRLLPAEDKVLP